MPTSSLLFAFGLLDNFRHWFVGKDGSFTMVVFFGVAALVALIVFGWALMVRNRNRHHTIKPAQSGGGGHARSGGGGLFSHRKHRRKKHRPTNPTLAETGGLPPSRDSKTPPKSSL